MVRKIWIVTALMALLLSMLACSINLATTDQPPTQVPPTQVPPPTAVPGGGGGGGGGGTATLNVVNNSGTSIFYLYISPSTSSSWGDDQLGADTISAGSSYTFTGITAGTYDLKAEDSSHTVIQTWMGVTLSGNVTWTVTGSGGGAPGGGAPGGGGGGTATLNVVNNSGTSIFYLYISPSTSSSWGDDQLGASTISAGSSYTFTGITAGTYDLKAEDSSHNVIQTWMGVTLSGNVTWTVTGSGGGAPGGGGGTATLNVVNNSGVTVFYLYVSPSTSSSWGEDRLGASTLAAGSSFSVPGLTPGTYDLKAEDSSHNVILTQFNVNLTAGTNTWVVTGAGGGSGGTASLNVTNNSGRSIFYFYISPSTSSSWGDDQLGASTISAGSSYTFTGITPGTYDLKAEDSSHTVIQTWMGVYLSSGTNSWTVTGSGGGGGTATLTVVNNSGTSIFYLYISPSTSSSWGDDQLGASTIPAGSSYTFTGITPGTYDLKAEDSSHNVIRTWMGVSLSGSTTWTVTP